MSNTEKRDTYIGAAGIGLSSYGIAQHGKKMLDDRRRRQAAERLYKKVIPAGAAIAGAMFVPLGKGKSSVAGHIGGVLKRSVGR